MPKLIIDDIAVEVAPGTSVLEAARSVGITIPHFCYHPALAIAAACRLCAVKMVDGPVKGIQMSCALPAQDGMVVSTTDPEAVKMRALVIEWLMINHPHDCPVCDEGGECLLQDFTIAGGHSRRRYRGPKRTFQNQYLGEYIYHEMNRCIECYRCARFYQEYAGGTDFGTTGSAGRVYFGRCSDGPLESPFSGNLVDICPTGVFTDKTARFRARYWDYQMAPAVCPGCSVGCSMTSVGFHRELLKVVGRRNDQVNGWFICDRSRFEEKKAVNDPARPRTPLVDREATSMEAAIEAAASRIGQVVQQGRGEKIAFVGSPRLSVEGGLMLARLSQIVAGSTLSYFSDSASSSAALQTVEAATPANVATLPDVQRSDCIVILCSDLLEQAPMLALAVRQAAVKGAPVFLVARQGPPQSARPLPFPFKIVKTLEEAPLDKAKQGVLICHAGETELRRLPDLPDSAKLVALQQATNSFGMALLAKEFGAVPLEESIAKGAEIIVSFEADLPPQLLERANVLAAADWRATDACSRGSVLLPTTSWAEGSGVYVSYEGRAQRSKPAIRPGLPLRGLDPAFHEPLLSAAKDEQVGPEHERPLHPPRVHRLVPPGGDVLDAWRVMALLIEKLGGERVTDPFQGRWQLLRGLDPDGGGMKILEALK